MAVPYVVGALALMKSFAPNASADELLYALKYSAQSLSSNVNFGLVDALAAIHMLESAFDWDQGTQPPCLTVELTIKTDEFGEETAYRLRRMSDLAILWKGVGLESYSEYVERSCVDPNDCYEFIVRDTYGDGIQEPGGIMLTFGDQTMLNVGRYGPGGKLLFGGTC
jgi:hypothetical protein